MSGIAGIIHFDGAPVAPGLVEAMTSAMPYRGPDGIHHWSRGSVALGQCMLRTTPESLEEHQPLPNEDESLVLVLDGRVDNWEELRRELLARGAALRDRSDAELVLRAYESWGRECLHHIDGDFALVIWDARRREAFCARDRVGNKPLHYRWDGKTLAFASELHPILALPWVKQEFNEGMLAEFLAADWLSRDETFWLGIMRLMAAHRMAVGATGPRLEKYWAPDLWVTLPYTRDEEFVEHYRELFTDVVRRMSRSCHPVACEVSGGLDSSAVFAVAENLRRQDRLPAPAIDGYALDFHDDVDANELEYGRAVGRFLGVTIHEISPTTMPTSVYRETASFYRDFPGYPNGIMGLGVREGARARGSRVLLTGIGGDEWVDGSRTYYAEALAARHWTNLYAHLTVDRREKGLPTALRYLLQYGMYPLLPLAVRGTLRKFIIGSRMGRLNTEAWLTPNLRRLMNVRRAKYRVAGKDRVRRVGQRVLNFILSDAYSAFARESEERLSSSAGLEIRRPFFDPRMIQFCFATPERLRLRGRIGKAMHRQAMIGLLPETVLSRETKASFMIAFRRHLEDMTEILTEQIPARRCLWIRPTAVGAYCARQGNPKYSGWPELMLWTLFTCDAICRNVRD
jgi:asparagine synthase (glutamine-hydrolysing)